MYQKMMDKEFGIKAIAFIFSVSDESIEKTVDKIIIKSFIMNGFIIKRGKYE